MRDFPVLSQLFQVERHRQRAANVGMSVPMLLEVDAPEDPNPILSTNMRGTFLRTRVSSSGQVRYGFSPCEIDQEDELLVNLYHSLARFSRLEKWGNITHSVIAALAKCQSPSAIVLPLDETSEVGESLGVKQFHAPLPKGCALVVADPSVAGIYTRVGDYVGIVAYRVPQNFWVVERGLG